MVLCWIADSVVAQRRPITEANARKPQATSRPPQRSTTRPSAGPQRAPQQRQRTPQVNGQRQANPRIAQRNKPRTIQRPKGFPIPYDRQQRVDQILKFWEINTSKVKTFKANFERREYDPVMGPVGKPSSIVLGHVKYAAPDKGLFQDSKTYVFNAAPKPGEKPYVLAKQQIGEDWVCDGKSIFMKEPHNELLVEQVLPPELQGKAIAMGPLPFLFGAKAETMKKRFWIREATPKENPNGDYYLQAIPKTRDDRANYESIVVVLDKKKFLLPKKMEVTIRTFQARPVPGKPAKVQKRIDIYTFKDRKPNDTVDQVREYFAKFVAPDVPPGWKRVKRTGTCNPSISRSPGKLPQIVKPVSGRGYNAKRKRGRHFRRVDQ